MNRYSYNVSEKWYSYFNYTLIFKKIFNMTGQLGPSWISSNPRGLCFCDNSNIPQKYHCRTDHPIAKVYPGARFSISAVIVGQFNGTTIQYGGPEGPCPLPISMFPITNFEFSHY